MIKRAFIAIPLPEDIKNQIVSFQKKTLGLPINWTKKENLHITLLFLGYLNEDQLSDTIEAFEEIISYHSLFSITLSKYCYGPPNKKLPRMVWIEIAENPKLLSLQNDLKESLFSLPSFQYKEKQNREYSSHITLGRIRQLEFAKLASEQRPNIDEDCSLVFSANSVAIMESQLKKTGAEYTILKTCNLKHET